MKKEEIENVLNYHKLWLNHDCGQRADLRSENLSGADLRNADLRSADLGCADLGGAKINNETAFFAMNCPEKGSFVGF